MRLSVILLLFLSSSTFAFSFDNHRIVCQMAYEQLSTTKQAKIDALIKKSPHKSFALACPWPDQIRNTKGYTHTKTWHYINVPRQATQVSLNDCPEKGCALSALKEMQYKLKNNPNNDWQALLFVSHIVADIHQPLHVGYSDDAGGNQKKVTLGKRNTNLHQLWDGALLKRQKWTVRSERLYQDISPRQKQSWRSGSPEHWATESLLLTREIYRLHPKSNKINDKYRDFFSVKLEQQLQKASVRLAFVLDQSL